MTSAAQGKTPAYVGLGSNLDDPVAQIERALLALDAIPDTELVCKSSLYRSAPFGPVEQPEFVNAVALVMTSLPAAALLGHLQAIERSQGRKTSVRWGPRVLDLDLLVFGDRSIDAPNLKVPHPGIGQRNFVLLPLREIAAELVIPCLGRVADIAVNELEPHISRVN
jgi:2-amino-4-hydroxy-6-hydroxymethyldihydropteridine diphosphokinase